MYEAELKFMDQVEHIRYFLLEHLYNYGVYLEVWPQILLCTNTERKN